MIDVNSKYYPYIKSQEAFYTLSGTEFLPRKICNYIIDAPNGEYTPKDDNNYPRCKLWKYLYYDGAKPLNNALPTIEQKMSVVFDPDAPENPPTDKGYRLIPQIYTKQSQTVGQTRIHVYMGRSVPSRDDLSVCIAVIFDIYTHYKYELNTKTDEYSRCFAIEQAIIEAFHGVNMDGVGTFFLSKSKHPDCGSNVIFDGDTNVGRRLTMAFEIATTESGRDYDNLPFFNGEPNIRTI
ncbi:MAG: hypothetical protein IKU30_02230 [Clostridia bacterium]|nr:hypothetical protein [Clostridia bacterium]